MGRKIRFFPVGEKVAGETKFGRGRDEKYP